MSSEIEVVRRIGELERLASTVLRTKKRVRPRRPIVIEFAGSPKSGKTTAIGSLDIFLRRNGFRTLVLTEKASICPIPNKFDPVFNIWTGCQAVIELMDSLSRSSKSLDVIILDRGFFDALCWFEWQRVRHLLREEDYRRFTEFFLATRFRMAIDLVLAFTAEPRTSIEREYRHLLTRKEGSIMRHEVLSSYLQTIHECGKKYANSFRHIINFRTDDKDQHSVSYEITKLCLDKLAGIADERIGFVRRALLNGSTPSIFKYSLIRESIENNLEYDDRKVVEGDKDLVQIIPIAVVRGSLRDELMVARKSSKAVDRKSPDRDRVLAWFGGHVREEDANFLEEISALQVFKQCLYREVKEEIGIDVDPTEQDPHCIWIRDGTKSEQHLAVVFVTSRDFSYTKVQVDGDELVKYEKKGKIGTGTILDFEQVYEHRTDTWTIAILQNILSTPKPSRVRNLFDIR